MFRTALFFFVFIGLFLYLFFDDIYLWSLFSLIIFLFLVFRLKKELEIGFPIAEFVCLAFLIENSLSLILINLIDSENVYIGKPFFLLVPIESYLPFASLSSLLFYVGFKTISVGKHRWVNFIINYEYFLSKQYINSLLAFGFLGLILANFNLGSFSFITYALVQLFSSGLLLLLIKKGSFFNLYFLVGLLFQFVTISRTGMFGSLIFFVVYVFSLFILRIIKKGFKFRFYFYISLVFFAFLFLSISQIIKIEFRNKVWFNSVDEAQELILLNSSKKVFDETSFSLDLFKPILYRLNQGYLVSSSMEKVPTYVPFEGGRTILFALRDGLIPRFLFLEKEEAGGRAKIRKFTNITLVGSTSMNIGILGEAYVNFGKFGSIILFFIFGIALSLFEKHLLNISQVFPIYLIAFPLFFSVILGSGSDFLFVFNTIIKSYIFLYFLSFIIKTR